MSAADAATAALAKNLGVSFEAARQIQSIEDDKATRSPAQQKLSSDLIFADRMASGLPAAPGVQTLAVYSVPDSSGRVKVIVDGVMSQALTAAIVQLGGTIDNDAGGDSVVASLPLHKLETLAGRSDVKFIRPFMPPQNNRIGKSSFAQQIKSRPLVPYRRRSLLPGLANALAQQRAAAASGSQPPHLGSITNDSGNTADQGAFTHDVPTAVSKFGVTGSGIRIGVISDGDAYMANSQATGDLPATDTTGTASGSSVTVVVDDTQSGSPIQDGPSGNSGEGTAMMCIVHDMAPNAKIFFASADYSEAQFAKNILLLRFKYHCDIICDDVYYYDEPVFSDGPVAQAVNDVVADGALYFSSAGNEGHQSTYSNPDYKYAAPYNNTASTYEADFLDGGAVTNVGGTAVSGNVHQFASGITSNTVNYPAAGPGNKQLCILFWSDPANGSSNDYDFFSLNGSSVYSSGVNTQNGSQPPYEFCYVQPGYNLVVLKKTGAAVRAIHIDTFGPYYVNAPTMNYTTNGQTHGHNSTLNGFGVAATPAITYANQAATGPYPNAIFSSTSLSDFFSSDGPREVFYNVVGGPLLTYTNPPTGYTVPNSNPVFNPINTNNPGYTFASGGGTSRLQPDITAADGVSTGVTGGEFDPFFGTSAAAPHAASIAALVKSYSTTSGGLTINGTLLSVAEMHTVLQSTAIDIEKSGFDNTTGAGIVMPAPAVQYLVNFLPVGSITSATQSTTGATITWSTDLPAGSAVNYGTTTSLGNTTSNSGDAVTSHSVSLTGLQPGTLYYYQVVSSTATGSASYTDPTSSLHTFATSAAAAQASLAVTGYSVSSASGVVTVAVKISNRGTGAASGVQVTTASLGGTSTTASLPVSVGSIAAGSTATATLTFTSPGSGTVAVLRVSGSDSASDSFSFSSRITVP